MDNVVGFPEQPRHWGVEFVGPFVEEWRVTCDGYRVPNLTMRPAGDGRVALILDHRFMIEAPEEEAKKWVWFIANAMAIGAGYSCFGENSVRDPNPFKVIMSGIGAPEPK